jgi:hypothetical protein
VEDVLNDVVVPLEHTLTNTFPCPALPCYPQAAHFEAQLRVAINERDRLEMRAAELETALQASERAAAAERQRMADNESQLRWQLEEARLEAAEVGYVIGFVVN